MSQPVYLEEQQEFNKYFWVIYPNYQMVKQQTCHNPPLISKNKLAQDDLKAPTKSSVTFLSIPTTFWAPTPAFAPVFTLVLLDVYIDVNL